MKLNIVKCQIFILVISLFIISACSPNKGKVQVVEVSSSVMGELTKLDTTIVFFTSRDNPIKRLDDLTSSQEVAMWGFELFLDAKKLLAGTAAKGGGIIGVGGFSELFNEHPKLRFFVTYSTIPEHKLIVESGGGIRVKFVENASFK